MSRKSKIDAIKKATNCESQICDSGCKKRRKSFAGMLYYG